MLTPSRSDRCCCGQSWQRHGEGAEWATGCSHEYVTRYGYCRVCDEWTSPQAHMEMLLDLWSET